MEKSGAMTGVVVKKKMMMAVAAVAVSVCAMCVQWCASEKGRGRMGGWASGRSCVVVRRLGPRKTKNCVTKTCGVMGWMVLGPPRSAARTKGISRREKETSTSFCVSFPSFFRLCH